MTIRLVEDCWGPGDNIPYVYCWPRFILSSLHNLALSAFLYVFSTTQNSDTNAHWQVARSRKLRAAANIAISHASRSISNSSDNDVNCFSRSREPAFLEASLLPGRSSFIGGLTGRSALMESDFTNSAHTLTNRVATSSAVATSSRKQSASQHGYNSSQGSLELPLGLVCCSDAEGGRPSLTADLTFAGECSTAASPDAATSAIFPHESPNSPPPIVMNQNHVLLELPSIFHSETWLKLWLIYNQPQNLMPQAVACMDSAKFQPWQDHESRLSLLWSGKSVTIFGWYTCVCIQLSPKHQLNKSFAVLIPIIEAPKEQDS